MTSEEYDNLSAMLAAAGRADGLSPYRCRLAASVAASLAEDARRLEAAAVPLRVRAIPDDAPNVIRFETAGSIQSRRNLLACALWPAAVMVPMAALALLGAGL